MKAFRKAVEARCALALSRLLADPDDAELEELWAGCLAHSLGWDAFHTGAAISPLLSGEDILRHEWESGRMDVRAQVRRDDVLEEMNAFPTCFSDSGNPCHFHG